MRIPKRYGQSKSDNCPFCGKQAITRNKQKLPVCTSHSKTELPLMKCICGETMDMMSGKYGPFFSCMKHGNMNLRKALEINPLPASTPASSEPSFVKSEENEKKAEKKRRTETVVTSDELDWMF